MSEFRKTRTGGSISRTQRPSWDDSLYIPTENLLVCSRPIVSPVNQWP
ncbi:13320_t:CDS:2 [Acaulospora colombiana]|uniref:13320_t:CDS:1 n=1 Tax=Acaulospora colombiana TaxID=27376 RepID=A0ACA9NC82_9GLOM|nr:13320_t:CDS:2 [Acaulospora colombiana]